MQAETNVNPPRWHTWHALAAIVVVGALLRFFRLEHQSFWYDESVSARYTTYHVLDVLLGRELDLGNPPLHYALLNLWSRVFGPSDAALRSLSAVASVAGIPLVFVVARRLVGNRIGLVAAALAAISPPLVYFAQETRTYALLLALTTTSIWSLLRAEDEPDRIWPWLVYGATVFLCPYSHYFAFFFLAGQVVIVLALHRRDRKFLGRWALAVAAGAILFSAIWLPSFWAQLTTKGNLGRTVQAWYLHVIATPMVFSVGTTLLWKGTATWAHVAGAVAALAAFGTAFFAGLGALRRDRRALTVLLAWLLSPIVLPLAVSLLLFPLYNVRYALIGAPAFLIIVAAGLVHLSRRARVVVAAGVVSTSLASLALYFTTTVKDDWRSAAAWLDTQARPADIIAFDVDTGEAPYARYARGSSVHLRLVAPDKGSALAFVGTADRLDPPHDVGQAVLGAPRVWLVVSDLVDGSMGYYEALFEKRFVAGPTTRFKGIEITPYVPRQGE